LLAFPAMVDDKARIEIPASCHRNVRVIYDYWLSKCGGRLMPARSDLDPTDMPKHLLPGICLVDVVPDQRRYVYRLVGTADVEVEDTTPRANPSLKASSVPRSTMSWPTTTASPQAAYRTSTRSTSARQRGYVTEATIFLPLSEDGTTVNKILVFSQSREMSPAG
jgi:PAS domain